MVNNCVINSCGLCRANISHHPMNEPIDLKEYDKCGRENTFCKSVELRYLPEKVKKAIYVKATHPINEDYPICAKCYSKTLDEIWIAEKAVCKDCSIPLEEIGFSYGISTTGHDHPEHKLFGCPMCRLVYYMPKREITV